MPYSSSTQPTFILLFTLCLALSSAVGEQRSPRPGAALEKGLWLTEHLLGARHFTEGFIYILTWHLIDMALWVSTNIFMVQMEN